MDKSNEQETCNGDQHEDPAENMDEEAAAKEKLTADPNKVKFTPVNLDGYDGKNGEAKVDIYVAKTTVGMGKEELMKYANEPFWVRLRMFLFAFFWIAWIAMLVGTVAIILVAPRCPPATRLSGTAEMVPESKSLDVPGLDGYQKTTMYQVDVETFKDSNEDGEGNSKGNGSGLDGYQKTTMYQVDVETFKDSNEDGEGNSKGITGEFSNKPMVQWN